MNSNYFEQRILDRLNARIGATESYSQEGEDLIINRIFLDLKKPKNGFFIDVGAHDPTRFSNTYLLYRNGWRGINIDPMIAVSNRFQKIRSRDINLPIGIAKMEGQRKFFFFDEPALNTGSVERAQEVLSWKNPKYKLIKEQMTDFHRLETIVAKYKSPLLEWDLLTVDAENLDEEVLLSNDWETARPTVVVVESRGDLQQSISQNSIHFLQAQGYKIFSKLYSSVILIFEAKKKTNV